MMSCRLWGNLRLKQVEVDLIEWWISEGADPEMKYGAGPSDSMLANSDFEHHVPYFTWRTNTTFKEPPGI